MNVISNGSDVLLNYGNFEWVMDNYIGNNTFSTISARIKDVLSALIKLSAVSLQVMCLRSLLHALKFCAAFLCIKFKIGVQHNMHKCVYTAERMKLNTELFTVRLNRT